MKTLISLLSLITTLTISAQESTIYQTLDSLLAFNTMIEAVQVLDQLENELQADTIKAAYWLRYSNASRILHHSEIAKSSINKAIQLAPQNANYYYEKGRLYNDLGEFEPALIAFDQAIQLDPQGEYIFFKGVVYHQLGKFDQAIPHYIKAIQHGFKTSMLLNNLAIGYISTVELDKASDAIKEAINMDPNNPWLHGTKFKIDFIQLDTDAACIGQKKTQELGGSLDFYLPDSICNGSRMIQLEYAGTLLAVSEFYQYAIIAYTHLINDYTPLSEYYINRGYAYYKIQEWEKAEADYLQAESLNGQAINLLYENFSLLYYDLKNYRKSMEYILKWIKVNPKDPIPYIERGRCLNQLNREKEAIKSYNKALALDDCSFRAFAHRAAIYLENGEFLRAYDDAIKAIECNKEYYFGYLILGETKIALGMEDYCDDFQKAKQYGAFDHELIEVRKYCN